MEDNTILIYNGKGSVGKTPISHTLARSLNLKVQTNDVSAIVAHRDITTLTKELNYQKNTIYDCGGFAAAYILKLAACVDLVIVPVFYDDSSLVQTNHTLKQILPIAKKVIVVTTKTEGSEAKLIRKYLNKRFKDLKYFNLPKTKALAYSLKKGKTIKELIDTSEQHKKWFTGFYKGPFLTLLNYIKKEI